MARRSAASTPRYGRALDVSLMRTILTLTPRRDNIRKQAFAH
ncbi:hypothetical protein I550_5273 [Mycobacterium intracellulare 1956]|uniref:Uncharacterized protein n=1 Tax=Mycobacterium intracellulare 1956 TaxID=1299331 RepID=X8CEB9_MYCIT|nr:hypothetical protein I550_5273 [Mycobacterium intracellulare 1956]